MDLSTALTIGQSKKLGSFLNGPSIPPHLLTARLSALPSTSFRTSPRRTGRTSHGRDCASRNTPDQSACRSRHDLPNQTRCQFPPLFASRKMAAPSDFKPLTDLLMAKKKDPCEQPHNPSTQTTMTRPAPSSSRTQSQTQHGLNI